MIVSGARTPIGRLGGAFRDMRGSALGAVAIRAAVERAGIAPEHVDEVIMGNVLQRPRRATPPAARRSLPAFPKPCRR